MTDVLVIMPTFDHQETLRYSIPSVLAQTVGDLELVVIGDGAPPETEAVVAEFAAIDSRVRYLAHAKSPRHGEAYRDPVIRESAARIVAYCSDDDLWLPWHLEHLTELLSDQDFAHTLGGQVEADGRLRWWLLDLARTEDRRYLLEVENLIGLHAVAHTRESYLRLPEGWNTAPAGVPTDYHMWRKFLSLGWARAASGFEASTVHLPTSLRKDWSLHRRVAELAVWANGVADPEWCKNVWPGLVAKSQFTSWQDTETNLRANREYLTQVLAVRDEARAELISERASKAAAFQAEREKTAALLVAEREKATARIAAVRESAASSLAMVQAQVAAIRRDADITGAKLRQADGIIAWMEKTLTWRIREKLLRAPILGSLLRRWRSRPGSSP